MAVVKDDINEDYDDALATFVINSHMKNHPQVHKEKDALYNEQESKEQNQAREAQYVEEMEREKMLPNNRMAQSDKGLIPQDLLKKYLIYAKRFIKPKLSEIDQDKITSFYADIRRESNVVGGIPIAVRHIESVIRMSEAFAKIHLREHVRSDDIDNAIEMLLDSFIQSQKLSVARQLSKKFEKYKTRQTDTTQLLLHTLKKIMEERAQYIRALQGLENIEPVISAVPIDYFENESKDFARHNLLDFYNSPLFRKSYKKEGDKIVTLNKI